MKVTITFCVEICYNNNNQRAVSSKRALWPVERTARFLFTCGLIVLERGMTLREIGEVVMYGTDGLCRINDIVERDFGGSKSTYYVLNLVYRRGSVIYVPVGNEKLESKMRTLLSETECKELIRSIKGAEYIWIDSENERKQRYREILGGNDRRELVRMIKTLYEHRRVQEGHGKKMHMTDQKILKDAERIFYDEVAHNLNMRPEEVHQYILDVMAEN